MEELKPNRFDYVKYDEEAMSAQNVFKESFMHLEADTNDFLKSSRAKALVFTKLEEAYMWVGKAIRDDQIERIEVPPPKGVGFLSECSTRQSF